MQPPPPNPRPRPDHTHHCQMGDGDEEDAVVLLVERVAKSLHDNGLGEVCPQGVCLVSVSLSLPRCVVQKCPCREEGRRREGGGKGEGKREREREIDSTSRQIQVTWQYGMAGVHCMT